jgi:hypothetical protein
MERSAAGLAPDDAPDWPISLIGRSRYFDSFTVVRLCLFA